jgi:hypothetical protein
LNVFQLFGKMIHVADSDPSRCKAACEFLEAGQAVSVGDYSVRLTNAKIAEVCVPTRWAASNQTKERQEAEIGEAKRFFRKTVSALPYLGAMLAGLKFSFLVIDDYGTGSVALAPPTTPNEI